jgi:hypothetical protein
MEHKIALQTTRKAVGERVRYVVERRKQVAQTLTCSTTSDKVSAKIICEMTEYITSHLGRNAYGTSLLQKGRIKDYKARQGRRLAAVQNTFAHNVDVQRAWSHFRAHFVPGGSVWAKQGRVGKRGLRSAVYEADTHLNTYQDYVGAFAILKGE